VPPAISTHTRRLAVFLEVLALLALVSRFFPLAIASPIWWLRLGDSLVNLAPVLLLAVILLRFAVSISTRTTMTIGALSAVKPSSSLAAGAWFSPCSCRCN